MTRQPIFTFAPSGQGTPLGAAAHLIETEDGGQVFIHGLLTHAWEPGDEVARRFAAVNLHTLRVATATAIATAFGVAPVTLWQWKSAASTQGMTGLISEKRGPKGNSKLTDDLITHIHQLKTQGLSNPKIGAQVGVSEFSVRRALKLDPPTGDRADVAPSTSEVSFGSAEGLVDTKVHAARATDPIIAASNWTGVIFPKPRCLCLR